MNTQRNAAHSICVLGVGAVTATGLTAPSAAAAVRAGVANLTEHPFAISRQGDPCVVAMVPGMDPEATGADRCARLVSPALAEALQPLRALKEDPGEIPAYIGLPEPRPGVPRRLAGQLADSLHTPDDEFRIGEVRAELKGHSAGLVALESAARAVHSGVAAFSLVGGVDSYMAGETLDWIEQNKQLHTSRNAWGYVPGEAAGFCLICAKATAVDHGLPIKAEVGVVSTAFEKNRIKTETVCTGQGLTEAVRGVVESLPEGRRIDHTICDQNGEAYRADEFGFMLARMSEFFVDPSDFSAPADCWGDVGAASAPLFIMLIAEAARRGYAKGPRTLVWTSSEGGQRAAALLETKAATKD